MGKQQMGWLTHQCLQHGQLPGMLLDESSKLVQQQSPCLHVQTLDLTQGMQASIPHTDLHDASSSYHMMLINRLVYLLCKRL